jgi:hypothetical protein
MYAVDAAEGADLAELGTSARDGRAAAVARRRQASQGIQALNGGGNGMAATGDTSAPAAAANGGGNGAGAPPAASNGQGASNGTQGAPEGTAFATDGVAAAAQAGRAVSKQRRRQLSQGQEALNGGGNGTASAAGGGATRAVEEPPAASSDQGASNGTQGAASNGTQVATDGVAAAAQAGRAVSKQRRRQLSQGKQALNGAGDGMAAEADAGAPPAPENRQADDAGSGREQARARRAEASRLGSAAISRPQRQGRVRYSPKVIVSPTQRGQRVTGLRIGPGEKVTGDEPGAELPVSGTQYLAADGPAPAMGGGPKVGLVRTPRGLVVSGTTVRDKVPITGDEFGEHLRITGEADQKLHDDLTPRRDGSYRRTQFPRRADPHGATAVGLQPQVAASMGARPGLPLAITDRGLPVTGTAVGRSARVTGNEAGVCRPITGDPYQDPTYYSSECGGTGGGTAPAAHLNAGRLDPVTAGKVTVAQTWGGQRVTGPSVEHRPNVTGDEPGSCRPVTGTPYQGPSTVFGWCEPDEVEPATQRLDPRPEGVAVTGDVPTATETVTGTTEIGPLDTDAVTGTPYYSHLRPPEPAADDETSWQAFSVPVALARRLAGREGGHADTQQTDNAAPPASCVPGRITGSFAIGEGKVTGNNEFLFRPRLNGVRKQPVAVTGEGETEGRTITGSPAAWTPHHRVTGTEGYIAAGRNPSEGGRGPNGWAGARRFAYLATPGGPADDSKVTGRVGGNPKATARITVSGGALG